VRRGTIALVSMPKRTDLEEQRIGAFLAPHFPTVYQPATAAADEAAVIEAIMAYVSDRFGRMKYILGLALDFTILAQRLSQADDTAKTFRPELTEEIFF